MKFKNKSLYYTPKAGKPELDMNKEMTITESVMHLCLVRIDMWCELAKKSSSQAQVEIIEHFREDLYKLCKQYVKECDVDREII